MRVSIYTILRLAVAAAMLGALVLTSMLPASAERRPGSSGKSAKADRIVILEMHWYKMCLDADANNGRNGTRVQIWECNNSSQQKFRARAGTAGGPDFTLESIRFPGMCLDRDARTAGQNGGIVQLWQCNSQPQQNWLPLGGWIIGSLDDKVLDVDSTSGIINGTRVQVWQMIGIHPNPAWNQRWIVQCHVC